MEECSLSFDVCIVCALYEEASAVIDEFSARCAVSFIDIPSHVSCYVYRYTTIHNKYSEPLTILVAWLPNGGPLRTGLNLQPILYEFRPRFAAMTGFCAGDKEKVKLGDLVIAEYAYHYEAGKIIAGRDGQPIHLLETRTANPTSRVIQYAQGFENWKKPVREMKRRLFDSLEVGYANELKRVIGVMASGTPVRGDNPFPWLRETYNRNTVALDMEAATFYDALHDFSDIHALVVKGVCDYADMDKNDIYHDYAAHASAVYLLTFIQEYVTEHTMPPSSGRSHSSPPFAVPAPRVFVAYAPEDRDVLERLQRDMAAMPGLELWSLEREQFSLDLRRHDEAREAMRSASAVLLIASPVAASSSVIRAQMDLAADYQRPIIVIWAKGEEWESSNPGEWHVEEVLDARTEHYETAQATLVTCLKKYVEAVPPFPKHPRHLSQPRNPYKGLCAFTANDRRDFFGREALVNALANTLEQLVVQEQRGKPPARLLTVLGASGSGKSSVVLAGLLPCLKQGDVFDSQEWIYLDPVIPGTHPLEALAVSLAQQPLLGDVVSLTRALTSDSRRTLHLLARQLVSSSPRKVILFLDQFEEVFTLTDSEEERQHFFDLLITASTEPHGPLLVILTLRADFYGRSMHYPALHRLLDVHHVAVLPMEREDLRSVIEQPAQLEDVQVIFEKNLVGDLLFDMHGQVGALPLLQFTLDQLFARRNGHEITQQAYREIGGIKGALARHAESIYANLPSDAHRKLARTLFLRLIDPRLTDQDTTRRRATFAEFALSDPTQTAALRETTDAFVTARLLTTNEIAGTTTIEVSHEALIREWPLLADWLHQAREDIHLQQAISGDVTEWQKRGQPKDHLYRGTRLKEARAWAKRNIPSQNEIAFLQASVRQRVQFIVRMLGIVLLLLSMGGGAGWFYLHQPPDPTRVTTLDDDGIGSLRWVINNAPPSSNISIDPKFGGSIIALKSDLLITKNHLSIQGPNTNKITIITQNHQIVVEPGAIITFSNFIFVGNKSASFSLFHNRGNLTLINSVIEDNTLVGYSNAPNGDSGGIFNDKGSTLTLFNSVVSNNTAITNETGGGIDNLGVLTLNNSIVSNNRDPNFAGAGGIENGGTLTVMNSTITDNTSLGSGGISNGGTLTLLNSTVFGNTGASGGGVYNEGTGSLFILNSTIANNTAKPVNTFLFGTGGGIYNFGGKVIIAFSTFYGNTGVQGGNIYEYDLPNVPNPDDFGYIDIENSLIAGKQAHTNPDIMGTLTTKGYNLIQYASGVTFRDSNHKHYVTIQEYYRLARQAQTK